MNDHESDNDPRSPTVALSGNGYKCHKKLFNQLQFSFYRPKLQPYHLYSFRDIQRNSKSSQERNDEFQAWLLAAGEKRESLDHSFFFERFPGAQGHIFRMKEIVNIQIMQELDTVRQYAQNNGFSEEISNNVSDSYKVNDVEKQSPELPNN